MTNPHTIKVYLQDFDNTDYISIQNDPSIKEEYLSVIPEDLYYRYFKNMKEFEEIQKELRKYVIE